MIIATTRPFPLSRFMHIQKYSQGSLVSNRLAGKGVVNASLVKRKAPISVARPLLRVLGRNEMPGDVLGRRRSQVFQDGVDVYIARAELELRKAMELMAFDGAMGNSSLPQLTALSLPGSATSVLWITHAFLQERYPKKNDHSLIHHRNRDARMLYRQLAMLDLSGWAHQLLDQVRYDELPDGVYMPPGHPVPGQTYRCHPFRGRRNFYYPVDQYFSMLLKEREQALIALLSELGATKIVISSLLSGSSSSSETSETSETSGSYGSSGMGESYNGFASGGDWSQLALMREKIFEYPPAKQSLLERFDARRHPWLSCEPEWQSVVNELLSRGALSAQFELSLDVAGMLKSQLQSIGQIVPMLSSMELSDNNLTMLMIKIFQLKQVKVEFGP